LTILLNDVEARVLGALMEKESTTPEYYPLSLNALVNACNQKNNREPVMALDEDTVRSALHSLQDKNLAGPARAEGRVTKYEHHMQEVFNFTRGEAATMCVLLLRGPQTPGELRGRTERMHRFAELEDVLSVLRKLMQREPALVKVLPRQPGTKEARYTHLLAGGTEDTVADQRRPANGSVESNVEANGSTVATSVSRFTGFRIHTEPDTLAVEEPLEIQIGYGPADDRQVKSISVTMRTPGHDFELAAGFLMTEGVVRDAADLVEVRYIAGPATSDETESGSRSESVMLLPYRPHRNVVRAELAPDVEVSMANLERNFYTTSSCGICGKASLLALRTVCPPRRRNEFQLNAAVLYKLSERLRATQDVFGRTGGLHAAALFDAHGRLLATREDVGRHNAVDKLLGAEFLADRTPLRDCLLMLSGRTSFELLQKAVMGGIPMVVSVGAPSSLAVQVAQEFDITLIGFLREDHFNVYHGAEHLTGYTRNDTEVGFEAAN
jgi:FdhD protein